MAENVGGIAWTVDADTSGAVDSVGAMGKQVDKTEDSLKKLDAQTSKTEKNLTKLKPAAAGVNKAIGGMGRKAGQAGIQLQQFIGQIQGGQNAMLALSAQSADLGFVLGAPLVGAIVGISASLVGILIPALFKSGESTGDLTKKIKELVKASTLTAAQSKFLVNQTDDEIEANKKLTKEAEERILKTKAIIQAYDNLKKRQKDGNKLTEAEVDFLRLQAPLQDKLNKQVIEEAAARDTLKNELDDLTKKRKIYNLATKKSAEDQKNETDNAKRFTAVVEQLENALAVASRESAGLTDEAKELNAEFKAGKLLGGEATKEQIAEVAKLLNEVAEAQGDVKERTKATTTTEAIIKRGETPEDRLQTERDLIESFREKGLIDAQQYQDALTQIDAEGAAAREQIAIMAMGSFSNSFGELANVLKTSEGEQSTAYKAMFTLSKGFAVAQAGLNFSLALSNAMASGPFPWNLGAMATVAASGASLVGSIASATYSGRENGGSVIGGQTYEVGEKNKPELLMIPGNNGKVMSNAEMKSIAGGNGGNGAPIINNYVAGSGVSVEHRRDELTKRDVFDIVQGEMANPNSRGRRGMQQNSNLSGVLNGRRRT